MKKLIFLAMLNGGLLFTSCSNDENMLQTQDASTATTSTEKELVLYDFERNGNGFYFTTTDGKKGIKNLSSLDAGDGRCGRIYRGKVNEFTKWKAYDFSGNETNFIGYDMGKCGGVSDGFAHRNFSLSKDYKKGSLKIAFKYYKPGDFTGWDSYYFDIYISKRNESDVLKNHIIKIDPKEHKGGWISYKENLTKDLPKGRYTLTIRAGGSSAIDDIAFIEN
ncbi:hypothetical protein [Tenacibaculum sp. 190524A02b]|uniref:hypothetical protein n=1 Tax=Tenacibaculum vairaonense TaxID=3137860 RepID=UPI0031FB4621